MFRFKEFPDTKPIVLRLMLNSILASLIFKPSSSPGLNHLLT